MVSGRNPLLVIGPQAVDLVPEGLRRFLAGHGEREPIEVDQRDLAEVRDLAGRLRDVFEAADAGAAAGTLNRLLAESAAPPQLSDHDGSRWHLHVSHPDASWAA